MDNNWISIDETGMPDKEGKYLIVNYYKRVVAEGFAYHPCVSNFKFMRIRDTGERVHEADGGVFQDDLGYAQGATHWMPLPAPPSPLNEQEK